MRIDLGTDVLLGGITPDGSRHMVFYSPPDKTTVDGRLISSERASIYVDTEACLITPKQAWEKSATHWILVPQRGTFGVIRSTVAARNTLLSWGLE